MNKLISIIIAIYNDCTYIKQCVNSILNQTYQNFEIILINDGSTDNSLNICYSYAKNDNRIKVINQENKGIEKSRRVGISHSKGEYICFIDSDDWITNDYLELLINKAEEYNVDIVCIGAYQTLDKWGIIKTKWDIPPKGLYTKEDLKKYNNIFFINGRLYNSCVWGKLFKSSILKQNYIEPLGIHYGEDDYLMLKLSSVISSCYMIDKCAYFYRYGGSTYAYNPTYWSERCQLYWAIKNVYEKYEPESIIFLQHELLRRFYANIDLMIRFTKLSKKEIISFIESVFNSDIYNEFIKVNGVNLELQPFLRAKKAEPIYDYIYKHQNKIATIKTRVLGSLSKILN